MIVLIAVALIAHLASTCTLVSALIRSNQRAVHAALAQNIQEYTALEAVANRPKARRAPKKPPKPIVYGL